MNNMKTSMFSVEQVSKMVQSNSLPQVDVFCHQHNHQCNTYALHCCTNVARASYKTYALVYIFQLITSRKKFQQKYNQFIQTNNSPKKQIPKLIWSYLKSLSFTAIDFLIMRKVMCLYHKYINTGPGSLIVANVMGGLYLAVQSKNRQIEIALYCINKTTETVYNMWKRRYPNIRVPYGEAVVFAVSMAVVCYYYFNHKELFRPAYEKAFGTLFKNV